MEEMITLQNIVKQYQAQAYLVGGAVRDYLLERETNDFDLVIVGPTKQIANEFSTLYQGSLVELDQEHQIYRVTIADQEYDFADLQDDSIKEDLANRDFTINALAISLSQIELKQTGYSFAPADIQQVAGGFQDLEEGKIRAVSDNVFSADPIRLLRAIRFKAQLGFSIAKKTEKLMQAVSSQITEIASERIKEELFKILARKNAACNLAYLENKFSLLSNLFPDIQELKQRGQCQYHCEDIWTHSVYALEKLEGLLQKDFWANRIDYSQLPVLKFALLFHDIGKLLTEEIIDGEVHFYGHHKEGAIYLQPILEDFAFSNQEISLITTLIRYHMRPGALFYATNLTKKGKYRFFKAASDQVVAVCLLAGADMLSTRILNDRLEDVGASLEFFQKLVVEAEQMAEDTDQPLLTGTDLIDLFSLTEGPQIGEILDQLEEAQATGEITTREEAIEYVAQNCKSVKGGRINGPH
ncbi:CCA tRNA nucleotidyltransferase [Halanaerobaculum tunisiense]